MRIISGTARGKRLTALEGTDTRPTIDRVKEAIFSSIHFILPTKTVLDLFSGSGQLGIEALSRGAKSVDFVDASQKSIQIIKANLEVCGFENNAAVHTRDFESFLKNTKQKYDIIFVDPPYNSPMLARSLTLIDELALLAEGGIIVCESDVKVKISDNFGQLTKNKSAKYGNVKIEYFSKGIEGEN